MPSRSKQRILVVEDNVALASVTRFNLEHAGFELDVARNGREGWKFLQDEEYDLAILDHQMPEMTGVELCRRMREDPRHRDTPVVMLTAKMFELEKEYLHGQLGICEVLPKPFSPRALIRTVVDCLLADAVTK